MERAALTADMQRVGAIMRYGNEPERCTKPRTTYNVPPCHAARRTVLGARIDVYVRKRQQHGHGVGAIVPCGVQQRAPVF
jgi:hypothetical protein